MAKVVKNTDILARSEPRGCLEHERERARSRASPSVPTSLQAGADGLLGKAFRSPTSR